MNDECASEKYWITNIEKNVDNESLKRIYFHMALNEYHKKILIFGRIIYIYYLIKCKINTLILLKLRR